MKTLTKYSLILLATLSVSGCFNEDDKSYTDVVETSQNASQEELPIIADMECWYSDGMEPSHHFEVTNIQRGNGVYRIQTPYGWQLESKTFCRLEYR